VASSDGQTTVHEAEACDARGWATPCLSLSLSQALLDLSTSLHQGAVPTQSLGAGNDVQRHVSKSSDIPQLDGAHVQEESWESDQGAECHLRFNQQPRAARPPPASCRRLLVSPAPAHTSTVTSMLLPRNATGGGERQRQRYPLASGTSGSGAAKAGALERLPHHAAVAVAHVRCIPQLDGAQDSVHDTESEGEEDGSGDEADAPHASQSSLPPAPQRGRGRGRGQGRGQARARGRGRGGEEGGSEKDSNSEIVDGSNKEDFALQDSGSVAATHASHNASALAESRKTGRGVSSRGRGRGRGGKAGVAGRGHGLGDQPDGVVEGDAQEEGKDESQDSRQAAGNEAATAKHRVVQAFLSHFDAARQALPKIDVPEYAKAQRLSVQDTTLLLESGSWVLSDHAPDVAMSGLEEAALRKLLQVELRIHMKTAAKHRKQQEPDKDAPLHDGVADDKKRKRLGAGEEVDREEQGHSYDEYAGGEDPASADGSQPRAAQRTRTKLQASITQASITQGTTRGLAEVATPGEEALGAQGSKARRGGETKRLKSVLKSVPKSATSDVDEADEDKMEGGAGAGGRRTTTRPRASAKAVYVEEDSDQDMMNDNDEVEDDDDHRPSRCRGRGGGSKKGSKKGAGSGRKGDEAAPKQRRRRDYKMCGFVSYGGKADGGDAGDECGHVTTREEAYRQREAVVVKTLAWRQSLLSPHLVGLAKEGRPGFNRGDVAGVGLLALCSHQVLTVWAFWRRLPDPASNPGKGAKEGGKHSLPRPAAHDAPGAGKVQESLGCGLVAVVTPACLAHGGSTGAADAISASNSLLSVQWLHGASAAVAVGSLNGAVDILVFRQSDTGGGRVSLQVPLGFMEVAVRVCPPGGVAARHVVCCTYSHPASSSRDALEGSSKGKEAKSGRLPPALEACGRTAADTLPGATALVVSKGRGLWSWDLHSGLVRAPEPGGSEHGGVGGGNVCCLSSDGSGEHVVCVSSDGSFSLWRMGQEGGGMRLVTRRSCKVLSGSCCLLGAALSYHGCYLALAGRRVIPQRGTQSLTFPTGLEGLVFLERSMLSPCPPVDPCALVLPVGPWQI
jgi:hypothetical protein